MRSLKERLTEGGGGAKMFRFVTCWYMLAARRPLRRPCAVVGPLTGGGVQARGRIRGFRQREVPCRRRLSGSGGGARRFQRERRSPVRPHQLRQRAARSARLRASRDGKRRWGDSTGVTGSMRVRVSAGASGTAGPRPAWIVGSHALRAVGCSAGEDRSTAPAAHLHARVGW